MIALGEKGKRTYIGLAHLGAHNISTGTHGRWPDARIGGGIRRYVTGWVEKLWETRDTGFAIIRCTDQTCGRVGDRRVCHSHIICLG